VVPFLVLSRRNLADASRPSSPNPSVFNRLQPLFTNSVAPVLCFQQLAASFPKSPGWGVIALCPLCSDLSALCVELFPAGGSAPARSLAKDGKGTELTTLSTFRMNTCKNVSKESALTTFRMNTYAKRGEGGAAIPVPLPTTHFPATASRRDRKLPSPAHQRAQNKWFRANCHSADAPPPLAA